MSSKESTTTNSSNGEGSHLLKQKMSRKSSIPTSVRSKSSCGDSIGSSASQRPLTVTYKNVTTSGMFFAKKTTSVDCGVFIKDPGEIQMATGEWIHDYLNRSNGGNAIKRNKSVNNGQRLYVAAQGLQPPSSVQDNKKNIKRSWTISNPSGTAGPQMTPRNYYPGHNQHQSSSNSGESFTTTKPGAKEDNVPPPKIAPPVFISVPPPPPVNQAPVPPMRSRGHPTGHPPFSQRPRNVPVRSHSMSIADINRFYGSPPLPRFRPPPPPKVNTKNAGVEITELGGDSGSENEDEMMHGKSKNKTKKHFIHHNNQVIVEDLPSNADLDFGRKYKTLDPSNRVRSHHHHLINETNNYNSLDRGTRRKLPTVPNSHSHNSLNTQSLPRPPKMREQSESRSRDRHDKKRSQSFEEELEPQTNRRQLPNVPKKPGRQTRDNFNREPTPDYDSEKDLKNDNKTPLATSPVKNSPEKNPEPEEINKNTENLNNQARGEKKPQRSKQKLLQPESNDFKLVFISSGDSSKDSDQLNSSLENGQNSVEFIHQEMEFEEDHLNKKNLNLIEEKMSCTSGGTSIRTAATRDRQSPLMRSPKIPKIREIPILNQPQSIVDDRSITEMSIHDMQIMQGLQSRSLSESDLSEICHIGGASSSTSPVHMMAPSDEDDNTGSRMSSGSTTQLSSAPSLPARQSGPGEPRQPNHLRSAQLSSRRALPPAPVLPQQVLKSVAPSIYYSSSGNSSDYSSLTRSVSSVNPKNRAPFKPVRRSKSQRIIQHGGSVTLVSLNGTDLDLKKEEIKHVHHHHFVQGWDSNPGTSQTLPNRKKKAANLKPLSADDTVIKKQGVNGVKIQLNLNEQEEQKRRKYTLEELEVEGFSTSSSKNSDFEEEVDLNSLIEGDVDEIDEEIGDIVPDNINFNILDHDSDEKMDLGSDPTHSTTSNSSTRLGRMVIRQDDDEDEDEDFDDFSDIEPELVQLNRRLSDTEADFLDSANSSDRNKDLECCNIVDDKRASDLPVDAVSDAKQGAKTTKEVSSSASTPAVSAAGNQPENIPRQTDPVRKKSLVSDLIAKFEDPKKSKQPLRSTRSVTPEKHLDDNKPSARPKSAVDSVIKEEENDKEDLPLGAEAAGASEEELLDEDEMTRRNGAYTSYVLIGASAPNDIDTASIHSSGSSSANRVVVNVNKGVVLQDGRASNISIVSTESSDLGSPPAEDPSNIFEPVPDIPAKIRNRNGGVVDSGPDMQYFVARERQDYGQRSRGGEEYPEDDPSLSNYYTNALESSGPPSGSRRGRPPVIRAADRLRRQQMYHEEIGEGEIMVEYDEYGPEDPENFRITEVGPNGETYEVYTDEMIDDDDYDVRYESEEHSGDEEYVDSQDYPMCQAVQYDSEEYVSEGDEYFDREEELRGYNRQIDFTLHTILEESNEDSDVSSEGPRPSVEQKRSKRHSDPSEMEKYFLYGVGGGRDQDNEDEYTTGSSSPDEVLEDDLDNIMYGNQDQDQQPQSMMSDRQNTDDSGSVGSESDGQRTPDPKNKKKVVRAKGSSRYSSENGSQSDEDQDTSSGSMKRNKKGRRGSASDAEVKKHLEPVANGSPSSSLSPKDTPPITPLPSQIIEVQPLHPDNSTDDKSSPKSISPVGGNQPNIIRKHKSRDSGFVGSMDDLLRNENGHTNHSSDSGQSISDGENSGKALMTVSRLEKVSEVSGEDDNLTEVDKKNEVLSRKDSFTWSSDEDTNIMMNRMRAFFRSFLTTNNSPVSRKVGEKPPQLLAFEAKLTKMMRTVPGINEDQVKELVEYLSSEDTWSDSYDSSDYTSSDIDLEVYGINVNNIKDEDLIEQEFHKETALMYSKLMAKMQDNNQQAKTPPIAAKVMAHISSKLVALMHESESSEESSATNFSQRRGKAPPSRRYKPPELSRSVEVLDKEAKNLDSNRSNSEVDVWQGAQRTDVASSTHGAHISSISHPGRRGSLGQVSGSTGTSVSDLLNDDERWSWKGSFESALAMGSVKKSKNSMNEDEPSEHHPNPTRVTSARFKPSMVVENDKGRDYSTSSLPRLGTSSIKKQAAPPPIETSEATLELSVSKKSNIATNAGGPPRSARYKPHGYRPPPTRKTSPTSRKSSVDSVNRYTDDATSDFSSKSGTPSPILGGPRVPHGVIASRDLVRDFRESSVHSRSSSHGIDPDQESFREESVPREMDHSQRHPSPFNRASMSSLGSRSESLASVYSADGGRYGTVNVKGEVEFGLIYNLHTGSLELAIKQCKDLAAVDTKRNRSDPYVKVYLLPDKSKSGKRKTKVKKHTLNPVFDEMLKFQMPLEEVERRTLWLTVWHSDMFGRNDFLGEVMLPINTIPLDDPQPRWYNLQDRTEPLSEELAMNGTSYRGEIIVALKFVPPNAIGTPGKKLGRRNSNSKGTLLILVKEAKNLVSPKGTNIPDPFCKGYLLPEKAKGNKQKTGVCRKTVCPKWEHTMAWDDISLDALWDRSLELTVWDHDRLGHNEILGGVRFNLGTSSHQGHPVAWMDACGGEVTLWQQMLERPNFWVEGSVPLRTAEKLSLGTA